MGGQVVTTVSYQGSTPGCTSIAVSLSASATYHHIVTTVTRTTSTQAQLVVYYNRVQVQSVTATQTPFTQWVQTNHLQVSPALTTSLTPTPSNTTWQGSLYLFAMYNTALSPTSVSINYQSGLPNSQPVVQLPIQQVTVIQNTTTSPTRCQRQRHRLGWRRPVPHHPDRPCSGRHRHSSIRRLTTRWC